LLGDNPENAAEWQRMIVRNRLGLGDAIMAGNHLQADIAHYRAALEHYREALPICEKLLAADAESAADSLRLMQTLARIAAMLSEIGAGTNDSATLDEGFVFHQRTLDLIEAMLRKDPGNAALRRNYAGELCMTAYAKVLARRDPEDAVGLAQRAREIFESLAAADPSNIEARQDLAHAIYVIGRAWQLQGDARAAAENYRSAIAILEPLTASHPDNVETAYDLQRARNGLEELSQPNESK
jgi:tetratricopeptide (TPR) repeat protein